jgi:hypothetical protein
MKFKIGDRVRAIKSCDKEDKYIGDIGVVINFNGVYGTYYYTIRFRNNNEYTWNCEEESLELLESNVGKKLKDGYTFKKGDKVKLDLKHLTSGSAEYIINPTQYDYKEFLDVVVIINIEKQYYDDGDSAKCKALGKDKGRNVIFNLDELILVEEFDTTIKIKPIIIKYKENF